MIPGSYRAPLFCGQQTPRVKQTEETLIDLHAVFCDRDPMAARNVASIAYL